MDEFVREDGTNYRVVDGIFEAFFSTGESVTRWKLSAIEEVEFFEKWGTYSVKLNRGGKTVYSITPGDEDEGRRIAAWIESHREAAAL